MKRNYDDDLLYKKWRKEVRKRDKNACKWLDCGCKKSLQVHHIMRWADYPLLRYTLSNGITLCKAHHTFLKGQEETYQGFLFKCLNLP